LALLLLNIIRQILVWRWLPVKYLETAFWFSYIVSQNTDHNYLNARSQ
jgi:hypothetical protein